MKKTTHLVTVVAVLASAPGFVSAQEEIAAAGIDSTPQTEAAATGSAAQTGAIRAVVRGLYAEARVGGGMMLARAEWPDKLLTSYPDAGTKEDLGSGSMVHFAVGYDITNAIAVQAVGGLTLVSGGGTGGLVRDLSMVFGGPGLRLSLGLSERFHVVGEAAVGYVNAANGVERSRGGPAAQIGAGVEYFVHVRHFSVGVDLAVLAPFSPFRMFVGITPVVKYTFF